MADTIKLNFEYQSAQKRLFKYVTRGGGTYLQLTAHQALEVGGQRSGKTIGKLMYGVMEYCLRWSGCDILVLRRTFGELKSGVIRDFLEFVPKELYDYNQTDHVATFKNGSRIVFAGCVNNKEKDIEKYLGQSYAYILVDECGQFSPDAWSLLYARNLVPVSCKPDEHGEMPSPVIVGCTNPIGPFWEFYYTLFVKKEPWVREEGCRRDPRTGAWYAPDVGNWRKIYDPSDYAYNHTKVTDNPIYIKRDPRIIARLMALPPAMRKKYLDGYMDTVDGQYFDCFDAEQHVVDLREDPEAIIWEDWQPVWGGLDWGMGHWTAGYLFTKAQVKNSIGNYVTKTVCFAEIAPDTTGHTNVAIANMLAAKAHYPALPSNHPQFERISGKRCKVSTIYFSHEKFNRVMEMHSPADEFSRILRTHGLPSVSRATMDRIGSAGFMYNELKLGKLVILRSCPGIILALPSLQRDKDNLDDVLKVDSKADDRYDGFRIGLFGGLAGRKTPAIEAEKAYASTLPPFQKILYERKMLANAHKEKEQFKQEDVPLWQTNH